MYVRYISVRTEYCVVISSESIWKRFLSSLQPFYWYCETVWKSAAGFFRIPTHVLNIATNPKSQIYHHKLGLEKIDMWFFSFFYYLNSRMFKFPFFYVFRIISVSPPEPIHETTHSQDPNRKVKPSKIFSISTSSLIYPALQFLQESISASHSSLYHP